MTEKTKLHINQLKENSRRESLLIASGAVFRLISSQMLPVSDVEIAMELEISIPLVRRAIATLEQDQLVVQTYQGDWAIAFTSNEYQAGGSVDASTLSAARAFRVTSNDHDSPLQMTIRSSIGGYQAADQNKYT